MCEAFNVRLRILINVCDAQLNLIVQRIEIIDHARPIASDSTRFDVPPDQLIVRNQYGGVTTYEIRR
ncbi:hypothetical protein WI29_08375 [Burkholderia ubonensis]|nr:hypothetical protein WI31_11240 [Burkholderia ubonensis]KUZ25675.1 hypothetical protein WI29_08375 [Burkholderia ubonensis]KUZ26044.1 hypothetical protein WI30_25975 [Burkholderia ubonensis]KUZ27831.1 hypothetical protein WI32_27915 [Burkholderia ubonensis]KUZ57763.1 hypothetical protein WI33_03245 [Burkholderia ubonensis]